MCWLLTLSILFPFMHNGGISSTLTFLLKQMIWAYYANAETSTTNWRGWCWVLCTMSDVSQSDVSWCDVLCQMWVSLTWAGGLHIEMHAPSHITFCQLSSWRSLAALLSLSLTQERQKLYVFTTVMSSAAACWVLSRTLHVYYRCVVRRCLLRSVTNCTCLLLGHERGWSHLHPPPSNLWTNIFLNPYDVLITNQNVNIA